MGTRNLTCVVKDAKMVLAQYGQWDGYPSGGGVKILEFIRSKFDFDLFMRGLSLRREIVESDYKTIERSEDWTKEYPQLSRDMGAGILEFVQNQKAPWIGRNYTDFGYDGLFCEWAYVVDCDRMVLEVYRGFQKQPIPKTDRWYNGQSKDGYYPIKLVKEYRIGYLPTNEEFLSELEPQEEEEV